MSGLIVAPVEATRNRVRVPGPIVFQVETISPVGNTAFTVESELIQEALETELPFEEIDETTAIQMWSRIRGLAQLLQGEEEDDVWDEEVNRGDTRASPMSPHLGRRRLRRIP